MRIQNLMVVVLALSISGTIHAQPPADDSAEAKLREAMRRKMAEDAGMTTPPQAPATPAAPAQPAPTPAMATNVQASAVAPSDMGQSQEEMLREAVRKKLAEDAAMEKAAKKKKKTSKYAEPPMIADAPASMQSTNMHVISATGGFQPVYHDAEMTAAPVAQDPSAEEKLREAVRKTIAEDNSKAKAKTIVASHKPSSMAAIINDNTMYVPSVPMTPKEQLLAKLLDDYKADKITPTDYHIQRAKILAAP